LLDTYNAFDKDGTVEMAYEEYVEAWKFLGRGTNEDGIKKTFVDVDGSGLIGWNEFVFSLMGAKAMNFGALAQLEILNDLLTDTSGLLAAMKSDLEDANMMNIIGADPSELLTDEQINKLLIETFKKSDKDSSGQLECPEFIKPWRFLGLKGDNTEIIRVFNDVDTNRSGKIDKLEFASAIKNNLSVL